MITKKIVRIGNSAGVILPRNWYGGEAKIELIKRPINIKKDVIKLLSPYLYSVLGIYLIGSYARNEQTFDSDIDILVITNNINKIINRGKYEITLISEKDIDEQFKKNALPILPWLIEAKTILNQSLIEKYKKTSLTYRNIKWHIDTTKSAMNVVKEDIKLSEEFPEIKMMNSSAYSIILRLRTLYIIECLRERKLWIKKEFLKSIKKISGSLNAYEIYKDVKNEKKSRLNLSTIEAKKLMNYINRKVVDIEKWIKGKKD